MPIGKNAIKRVANNGYSNVKTSAPDMENSEVTVKTEAVAEIKKAAPKKVAAPKTIKASPKKKETVKAAAPKKSMETEPALAPVNTLKAVTKKSDDSQKRQGQGYVNLGGEMPTHLL